MATDVNAVRNFKEGQQFWTAGHNIIGNIHLSNKDGVYILFGYNANGKFSNEVTAAARSITTTPLEISYQNKAKMGLNHFSIGWKRYIKGSPDAETSWNLYGSAGFGLMFGSITNTPSIAIDTTKYFVPLLSGDGSFRRLTADLGLGAEYLLGGDMYFYTEGKFLLPTTDYPSKYLLVNNKAPLILQLGIGLRLLF